MFDDFNLYYVKFVRGRKWLKTFGKQTDHERFKKTISSKIYSLWGRLSDAEKKEFLEIKEIINKNKLEILDYTPKKIV